MDENTTTTEDVVETTEVSKMDKVKTFGRKYWKHTAVGVAAIAGAAVTVAAFWNHDQEDETEDTFEIEMDLDSPELEEVAAPTDDTPTE